MSELPGIVIAGASGRMGKMLIESVLKDDRMRLVGALERAGHDWVGRDVGVAMGGQPLGVPVFDDPLEPMANAQAVIRLYRARGNDCTVWNRSTGTRGAYYWHHGYDR